MQVYVADDHAIVRQGLKSILEDHEGITVTEAGSVEDLEKLLVKQVPEVVVLDLSLPGKNGLDGLKEIKALYPRLPVLILSIHPEDQYAVRCIRAGASGYITKETAPEHLVDAIQKVVLGELFLTEKVSALMADAMRKPTADGDSAPHSILSDREFQTLVMIAQGLGLSEIGVKLALSVKTISTYRDRILKKLGLKSNADLVKYVIEHKLLNAPANA